MLKYGILSTASIVPRFVAGIKESKHGFAYALASRDINKAQKMADELDIPFYYDSYSQVISNQEVDVIYIPTINSLHYSLAKEAINNHKHVVVEKPFTLDSTEAKSLFELAQEKAVFLMEAQKAVFLPATIKAKTIIETNRLGKIKYIELKAGFPNRFPYEHWMYDLKAGGGALSGSASYTIEFLKFLFNNPTIEISGTYLPAPTQSDEICNFQLKLNQEILVSSTIAMNVPLKNEAVFYGENGYMTIPNYWKSDHLILTKDNLKRNYNFPYQSEFVYEIDHINTCINSKLLTSPVMTPEMTIETIELVNSLYQNWKLK